jgi:dTDP-4-dehydrorhamnose 3,5-epimerase
MPTTPILQTRPSPPASPRGRHAEQRQVGLTPATAVTDGLPGTIASVQRLALPDVVLVTPRTFVDDRGFFYESFSERTFAQVIGLEARFVQDNHSRSARGVLRGLHYQLPPQAQGKLIRVVRGAVFDVAVDLRRSSPTYGMSVGVELSEDNRQHLWVPAGFAHGFLALQDDTEVLYKTTAFYDPATERCIRWDDPDIGIQWPDAGRPLVSDKDRAAGSFAKAEKFV